MRNNDAPWKPITGSELTAPADSTPWSERMRFLEAADQQAGAGEKKQGERDLRDHQCVAKAAVSSTGESPAALLQNIVEAGAGSAESGEKTSGEPGRDG